jgi:predicted RNase H-like HicB family nuclease
MHGKNAEGSMTHLQQTIKAVIRHGDASGYVAECIEVAVVTQGQTIDETVANLKDAVALHLEGEAPATFGLRERPTLLITLEVDPTYAQACRLSGHEVVAILNVQFLQAQRAAMLKRRAKGLKSDHSSPHQSDVGTLPASFVKPVVSFLKNVTPTFLLPLSRNNYSSVRVYDTTPKAPIP